MERAFARWKACATRRERRIRTLVSVRMQPLSGQARGPKMMPSVFESSQSVPSGSTIVETVK